MALLDNILSIYQSYPWIFDGIIICTLLGVLFRILFEKGKIGKEDQAKKLGGIFGFFLGISMVGYMQYRGWTIFIDGGPWVFAIVIISSVMVFWSIIDGYFEGKSRSITLPIAFVAATLLIYLFLNYVPSYMVGVSSLFGDYVWAWHLLMRSLMVFILFWAIVGAFGGGYPEGAGIPGIGRSLASGAGHIKNAYNWAKQEGIGKAAAAVAKAPFKAGWWTAKKGAKGGWWLAKKPFQAAGIIKRKTKGVFSKEELGKEKTTVDTQLTDAAEKTRQTETTLQEAKSINQQIAEILDKIRKLAKNTQGKLTKLKPKDCTSIADELKTLIAALEKLELPGSKILSRINITKESVENAKASVDYYTKTAPLYQRLPELISLIDQIDDEEQKAKYQFVAKKDQEFLENIIKAKIINIEKDFREKVDATLTAADVSEVVRKVEEINNSILNIVTQSATLIEALEKAAETKEEKTLEETGKTINDTCAAIIGLANAAIEQIGTFNKATIDSKLIPEVRYLEKAYKTYQQQREPIHDEYNRLIDAVERQLAEVREILSQQATPEEKAKLLSSLAEALDIIKAERDALKTLLGHAETFIRVLDDAFLNIIKGEEKIEAEQKVKVGGKTVLRTKGTTEEVSIPTGEAEAEDVAIAAIEKAKSLRRTAADELQAAKGTVKNSITALRIAENDLAAILEKATHIKGEQRQKLDQLLKNLNTFLSEEEDVKNLITMLDSYEEYIFQMIMARVKKHATAKSKPKMTINAAITEMVKIINKLRKKLELLNTEAMYLEKMEKEIAASIAAAGPEPIEQPIPPPPA
jgi:hypothetical protein